MKKTLLSFVFFCLIVLSSQANAQSKFTIHVFGGYSQPLGDFKSDIIPLDTATANWP
jgi:hypothetical protein